MDAYDITILQERAARDDLRNAGWCFGLPPGLRPEHWPLDPGNGYPLAHGFTLLIPDEYRCHGPDIVALSLFGTPVDMDIGEGGLFVDESIGAMFDADARRPADPDLAVFWHAARQGHPRLYRMQGVWDAPYAVVLLTRAEYDGALCPPPRIAPNRYRDTIEPPLWLQLGTAAATVNMACDQRLLRTLGGEPDADVGFSRALRLRVRSGDPNVGRAPRTQWSDDPAAYRDAYYETPEGTHARHAWADRTAWNHFGGTMRPGQNMPSFGPYYIEFEEYLGGFNFAAGTAQLDLETMAFNVMR